MTEPGMVRLEEGVRYIPGANALLGPLNKLVNWGRAGSSGRDGCATSSSGCATPRRSA